MKTPQLEDKNFSCQRCGPQKLAKRTVFAAHAIGNGQHGQHDDVQKERSLGMNLSQLNGNEND